MAKQVCEGAYAPTRTHFALLGEKRMSEPVESLQVDHLPVWKKVQDYWQRGKNWLIPAIFIPYTINRLLLVVVGYVSQEFRPFAQYPVRQARINGWQFTPYRLIDMWARWDSGWYLDIVRNGYYLNGNLNSTQSNIAFYPTYPYLVRGIVAVLPAEMRSTTWILFIGIVLSNIFLLAGLILFYRLLIDWFQDQELAGRAVLYVLFFPTAFIFSAFYTESTFFFLAIAAVYLARKKKWWLANLVAAILALTRVVGLFILLPLGWMYLDDWLHKDDRLHTREKIRLASLSFLFPLVAFAGFLLYMFKLTGSFLAPFQIQQAFGREVAAPWAALFSPRNTIVYEKPIDLTIVVLFLILSFAAFKKLSPGMGLFSLAMMYASIFNGTLLSTPRYCLVIFPAFILLAQMGKNRVIDQIIRYSFISLQIFMAIAWFQFYGPV
jgi:MFS family permease